MQAQVVPYSLKELRIGLVLYGGVSLAVYMNGIVGELWQLLRAAKDRAEGSERYGGTAAAYRRLLDGIAARTGVEVRPVIDTIAGSSAGGVNGVVLAKAIAEGADAGLLAAVWLDEADIANLRDDPAQKAPWPVRAAIGASLAVKRLIAQLHSFVSGEDSRKLQLPPGIDLPWIRDQLWSAIKNRDPRRTPLKGTFFAEIIAKTLTSMGGRPEDRLLLADTVLDLFLTQTDLYGWPRHLPISRYYHASSVKEQTHAHWIHLRTDAQSAERPFGDDGLLPLTFAARTTAGFPFAFAPCSAEEVARLLAPGATDPATQKSLRAFHRRHFAEHDLTGSDPRRAWMVDGGVIDNRPFGYVVDAIENKPAQHEVERVVIYLEPDPTDPPPAPEAPPKPAALAGDVMRLLRYEPILNDLERLRVRNAKVERLRAVAEKAELEARATAQYMAETDGRRWPPAPADLAREDRAIRAQLGADAPVGYGAYLALRDRRAMEWIASVICSTFNYPFPTTQAFLLREISRIVLGTAAADADLAAAIATVYDLPYRQRRLRYLVRTVNRFYGPPGTPEDRAEAAARRPLLDGLKQAMAGAARALDRIFGDEAALRSLIAEVMGPEGAAFDAALREQARSESPDIASLQARFAPALLRVRDSLARRFDSQLDSIEADFLAGARELLDGLAERGEGGIAEGFCESYALFPLLDSVLFPLTDTAEVQDLYEVQVMRISPRDGQLLAAVRSDLKSRRLGAFYGFFDRDAREFDLLWGRLDGAERIADLLARASGADAAERDEMRRAALRAVLQDHPATPVLKSEIAQLLLAL